MEADFAHIRNIAVIAFSSMGLIFTILALFTYRKAARTLTWQTTSGKILLSEVKNGSVESISSNSSMSNRSVGTSYLNACYPINCRILPFKITLS